MKTFLRLALVISALSGTAASARCRIKNETNQAFTIESGNVSNQRLGANTQDSIAAGKIIGKSDNGKAIGGFCKDGDSLVIREQGGVLVLMPAR